MNTRGCCEELEMLLSNRQATISARACCCGNRRRRELPLGGVAVWRCGIVGGEVVTTLSCDRLGGARQGGRTPQARAGTASRLRPGTDRPNAASDAARAEGGACCTRGQCLA